MKRCISVFVTFVCLVDVCLCGDTCEPAPEFQFPCYVDVCTFPRQFCNSDKNERRCSPCTSRICSNDKVPQACKYYCRSKEPTPAPPKGPPTALMATSDVMASQDRSQMNKLYLIMGCLASAFTVLVIIVIIVGSFWYYCNNRRRSAKMTPSRSFHSDREDGNVAETAKMLEEARSRLLSDCRFCAYCGNKLGGQEASVPPSYSTTDMKPSNLSLKPACDQSSGPTPASTPESNSGTLFTSRGKTVQVSMPFRTNPTNDDMEEGKHEKPWPVGRVDMQQQFQGLQKFSHHGQPSTMGNLAATQHRVPPMGVANNEQNVDTDTQRGRHNSWTSPKSSNYLDRRNTTRIPVDTRTVSTIEPSNRENTRFDMSVNRMGEPEEIGNVGNASLHLCLENEGTEMEASVHTEGDASAHSTMSATRSHTSTPTANITTL